MVGRLTKVKDLERSYAQTDEAGHGLGGIIGDDADLDRLAQERGWHEVVGDVGEGILVVAAAGEAMLRDRTHRGVARGRAGGVIYASWRHGASEERAS